MDVESSSELLELIMLMELLEGTLLELSSELLDMGYETEIPYVHSRHSLPVLSVMESLPLLQPAHRNDASVNATFPQSFLLSTGILQSLNMAVSQLFGLLVSEVQAGAFAVAPVLAFFAVADFGPAAVAHHLVAVLPNVPEVVLVDVALDVVAAQARACGNAAVAKHGTDVHAGSAEERVVAGVLLVTAEESFAAVVHVDDVQRFHFADEVEHLAEFLVRELEQRIVLGAALREHRRDTPTLDADFQEQVENFREFLEVFAVHASHHVEGEAFGMGGHVDGSDGAFKAMRVAAEMVVAAFEAVKADGERAQPGVQETGVALGSHGKSVRDHAPGVAALLDFLAAFFEVGAHQRFAARNHYDKVLRVDVRGELVEHAHEIFAGHVGDGVLDAVATAVQTVQVATQRAFPEKVRERVSLDLVVAIKAVSFESEFFLE